MLTLIPNSESNQCKNIVLEDKLSSEKKEEILSQAPLMQESTDSTQLDSPTSITNYGKVLQITMKRK